jgi:hypothetical protein
MDQSRVVAAVPGVEIIASSADVTGADIVVVDLARHQGVLPEIRRRAPDAWVVAYGPHVDAEALAAARAAGADRVLARSRFFKDPAAALTRDDDLPTSR